MHSSASLSSFVCLGGKPSWTAKLLQDPELLCSKIREEADELCETLESNESQERTAAEMADLLYHSMVLLNARVCSQASELQPEPRSMISQYELTHRLHSTYLLQPSRTSS